jgi:D-alanine transaminase
MILFNGKLIEKSEARVSLDDRGYYFGDGVYEVFRVYNGTLFECEAHLRRMEHSARAISLTLPFDLPGLRASLERLTLESGVSEGIVYLQVTRGEAPRSHLFPADPQPVWHAYAKEQPRPVAAMEKGIRAITVEDIRWLRCDIKSLNLLPNTMAKQQASDQGADDALFHRQGIMTECSAANLFAVRGGVLYTHPANNLILHGITRQVALRLANRLRIPVAEQPFTREELYAAEEAFLTSTTMEITPIVAIDGKAVGSGTPGPVTRALQEAFAGEIASSCPAV